MNSFSIVLGPCDACKKTPARYGVGPLACKSCGEVWRELCPACAQKRCLKCKGELAALDTVFSYSAFKAISGGNLLSLQRLVEENDMRLAAVRGDHGETLLHRAARAKGKGVAVAMCRLLLDRGVKARVTDDYGRTALHEAVRYRVFNNDVADLLRTSVNDQDDYGLTALMFAAEGAGLFGSRRGNMGIAQALIALGADPLIQNHNGVTALGYAMASNDTERNGDMIAFLQSAMLAAAALEEFKRLHSYTFADVTGALKIEPRKPKRSGKARATHPR